MEYKKSLEKQLLSMGFEYDEKLSDDSTIYLSKFNVDVHIHNSSKEVHCYLHIGDEFYEVIIKDLHELVGLAIRFSTS